MSGIRVMKSPDDLDLFAPDQIAITRKLDTEGAAAIEALLAGVMLSITRLLLHQSQLIPIPILQRAAYESSKRRVNDVMSVRAAQLIWIATEFAQRAQSHAEECLRDTKLRHRAEEMFGAGSFPVVEEED